MTSIAPPTPPTERPITSVFRRAASAEWTRLWTLRSTWWILLAAAGLMSFVGAAVGSDHTGEGAAPIWFAAQFATVPGQFAFLLIVLLAVTGEYATGAIHGSLTWVPRRGVLLAVRVLVPTVVATACAVVLGLVTDLVAWGFLGSAAEVVPADIAASLGRIALVVAFGSVLAAGIGLFLRSTGGTLGTLFLLIFALPVALGNAGVRWLTAVSDRLPGRAIVSLLVVDEAELAPSVVAAVMIVWTVVALVAGGWSLLRRDAT